ncbi:putative ferredoxin-like protein [Vibrio halioticoli NBRC 102217]|uniref:Putative ferredoxin-like protein n=1 Tax=Vibrio halioticoli NBRC 102217 TaxID=1219072 RepID=V5FBR8_9VIBR|nr:class I ribonucleotide reductase maintenance protein YfaE [Vibrio halioticoli]GAD88773.1 putative ferredoxin-like protein [Vibrio halioticoli NBRC 102217]
MHKVTINKVAKLVNSKSSTLLEAMETSGLKPEFNCRDGHCGACRCKLSSGEVEYIGFAMAYLKSDEILPCICRAKSDVQLEDVNIHNEILSAS